MKKATDARKLPGVKEELERSRAKQGSKRQAKAREGAVINKRFDRLSAEEKDDLLKTLALRFGLIKPD